MILVVVFLLILQGGITMIQAPQNYKSGLYLRLSRDDEGVSESSSIATQKKMLQTYAAEHRYSVYDLYIDDGYSGTNFDRPAFQRLISDIKAGNVNMVITKDLSRLGRDYIQSGEYIENFFPAHNVRYIAINDGYDSESQYTDIAPLKNVFNEMYARDISKKIRSAFQTRMNEGLYIGGFAPYGYKKDPNNKNHLIIDEEVAYVVRDIFDMSVKGYLPKQIADCLNQQKIMTPGVYRCYKNPKLDLEHYSPNKEWTTEKVNKILKNQVYLGHTLQGKTNKVSFKSQIIIQKPQDEWIIVKNTHEPIIDQSSFDIVRKRLTGRRISCNSKTDFKNIFSGVAFCADCGKQMSATATRRKDRPYNLVCGNYKAYGSRKCSNHFIDYIDLCNLVKDQILQYVNMSHKDRLKLLEQIKDNEYEKIRRRTDTKQQTIEKLKARSVELDSIIQKLYDDNCTGFISNERFGKLLDKYEQEQKDIEMQVKHFNTPYAISQREEAYKRFFSIIDEIVDIQQLTPQIVHKLVDKIIVHQGYYDENSNGVHKNQKIDIYFRFIGKD